MKKIFLLGGFLAAICPFGLLGQSKGAFRLGAAVNTVHQYQYGETAVFPGLAISFETRLGRHFTFEIATENGFGVYVSGDARTGLRRLYGLRPEFRYYFAESLRGVFVGAGPNVYLDVVVPRDQNIDDFDAAIYVGPNLSLGANFVLAPNLDLLARVSSMLHLGEEYLVVGGGVQLGYRF